MNSFRQLNIMYVLGYAIYMFHFIAELFTFGILRYICGALKFINKVVPTDSSLLKNFQCLRFRHQNFAVGLLNFSLLGGLSNITTFAVGFLALMFLL